MRMLLHVKLPHDEFNQAVEDGTVKQTLEQILEETRPEVCYFTEYDGQRGALLVVQVDEPKDVPRLAEPWFLKFNADVEFRIAMTPEDLGQAGLKKLGKKWA